jgi:hypothetical protein
VAPVSVAAPIAELWWIENNISTEETWTFDVRKQAIRDGIIIQLKNLGIFYVCKCIWMSYTTLQLIVHLPPTCGWVVIIQLKKVCSVYLQ